MIKSASLLLLALLVAPVAGALADPPADRELTRQVDAVFAEWDTTSSPGCALAVARDGAVAHERGYGMANLEHHLAITPHTVFRIGSTSKQFAAAAVVLLAEQGKLSLDDDVRKYVPELPEYEAPVTVRHLIHHTSGLRDYLTLSWLAGMRDEDFFTDDEAIALLGRQRALNFPPGDEHLYSNSGYFLLSVIVKRAAGQSLRAFAEEHIFKPLGMRQTHFHDDHRMIVEHRADGYQRTEDGGFEISKTTLEMVGDGGVFTTVRDLFLWDQNFYGNKLGKGGPALVEQLLTPGTLNDGERLDYAFGLAVDDYKGLKRVRHGGAFVGYRAEMIRFPEEALSVICLCNLAETQPSRLAQQVADLYLADKLKDEEADTAAAAPAGDETVEISGEALARLAGHYYDRQGGLLRRIEAREGKLIYVRPSGNETELAALAEDRFRMLDVPVRVEVRFEPLADGKPGMVVDDGDPTVFERIEPATYSTDELAAYAGRYYSEELAATYEISVGENALAVRIGNRESLDLTPALPDVFSGRISLEFNRDAAGRVAGFSLSAGRVRGLPFTRQ